MDNVTVSVAIDYAIAQGTQWGPAGGPYAYGVNQVVTIDSTQLGLPVWGAPPKTVRISSQELQNEINLHSGAGGYFSTAGDFSTFVSQLVAFLFGSGTPAGSSLTAEAAIAYALAHGTQWGRSGGPFNYSPTQPVTESAADLGNNVWGADDFRINLTKAMLLDAIDNHAMTGVSLSGTLSQVETAITNQLGFP